MRLVLVRHGQTDSNVVKALDTRPPGAPLNALGLAQADALAERLGAGPVSAVHASVATRARQTATPLAAALRMDVAVVEGVHEVAAGDLEGRSDEAAREEFDRVYGAWWAGDLDARLPGGESANDVRGRFLPALDRVLDGATGDVVLVSHGAAIRLAAAALLGDTAETWYVPNTGLVVLRPVGAGWELEHWDRAVPVPGDVTAGGAPA
ncbi:hypothetical protein BJF78_24300 [Pseudonocardia sp. CNS-139]|nr:hypothetical protein BJF78_24300 [Pseudonocardia sp. CNS-139]